MYLTIEEAVRFEEERAKLDTKRQSKVKLRAVKRVADTAPARAKLAAELREVARLSHIQRKMDEKFAREREHWLNEIHRHRLFRQQATAALLERLRAYEERRAAAGLPIAAIMDHQTRNR